MLCGCIAWGESVCLDHSAEAVASFNLTQQEVHTGAVSGMRQPERTVRGNQQQNFI